MRIAGKASGVIVGLALLLAARAAHGQGESGSSFTLGELEPLLQALQGEGLSRPILNEIFYDDRLHKIDRVVALNGVNSDSANRYEQFYSDYAIGRAKRFKRRHYQTLRRAEAEYGIPMNIIVAILLVETQFGSYPPGYRVLEVFTTLIVEANNDAIDRVYERVKAIYPDLDRDYFANRVTTKAEWAYRELIALLAMERPEPKALYDIKGSYAGAFGMPQFLPSSYLRWARDGNEDGRIDLDNTDDAIVSIANYLREHGWKRSAPLAVKMAAVWDYNHSDHYVEAVFEVSRRMMRPPHKAPVRKAAALRGDPHHLG